jgi:hypothetical protein
MLGSRFWLKKSLKLKTMTKQKFSNTLKVLAAVTGFVLFFTMYEPIIYAQFIRQTGDAGAGYGYGYGYGYSYGWDTPETYYRTEDDQEDFDTWGYGYGYGYMIAADTYDADEDNYTVTPAQMVYLGDAGLIEPESGSSLTTTDIVTRGEVVVYVSGAGTITIPSSATLTAASSSDFTTLTATGTVNTSALPTGLTSVGAVTFGLPAVAVTSDSSLTVDLVVSSSYNGQTLNVYRKATGGSSWLVATTCAVASATCSFTTTNSGSFSAVTGSPESLNFEVTVVGEEAIATVPVVTTVAASGSVSGATIKLPAGVTLTTTDITWDGSLDVAATTIVPDALSDSFDSAVVVSVSGPTEAVSLSDEMIVTIPYDMFTSLSSPVVMIVDGAGTTYTASVCTGAQYTGSTTSATDLVDSTKYSVSAGGQCYNYYNDNVYVATRHLSSFAAGPGASSTSPSGGSLLRGRSGGKKMVAVKTEGEKTTTEEEVVATKTKVLGFSDLATLTETDWRYVAIESALNSGLFSGEVVNGKTVFNMTAKMNRAQAAQVIARYYGCLLTPPEVSPFTDVGKDEWYAGAVSCLKVNNIVGGKTATKFDPTASVTRAEFFKMLVEAYLAKNPAVKADWDKIMKDATYPFVDVSSKDWYEPYVRLAYKNGLLNGYEQSGKKYMKGGQNIIRVEGASMVSKFLGL